MLEDIESLISEGDREHFERAWSLTRENHGDSFTFYLPGMIRYGNTRGLYPALSLTGGRCELMCEHCKGLLLDPMIPAGRPETLVGKCFKLARSGRVGVLLSGGSDAEGKLPWSRFYEAIYRIKSETDLYISVHCGFLDYNTASALKQAGVDQALIDVMGDERTAREIYHLDGLARVTRSLEDLFRSGLQVVPHVVAGLMYGKIRGEYEAIRIISRFEPAALVVVVLTPLKGTPMATVSPLAPIEVARLIARARVVMPYTPISLGCERPRNNHGELMEVLSLCAGATRMAVWSEKTVDLAMNVGLQPLFQPTCCSVPYRRDYSEKLSISF